MKKDKKLEGKIGALVCDLGKPTPPASVVNVTINPDPMLMMLSHALKGGKKKHEEEECEEEELEEDDDYFAEQRDQLLKSSK